MLARLLVSDLNQDDLIIAEGFIYRYILSKALGNSQSTDSLKDSSDSQNLSPKSAKKVASVKFWITYTAQL